MNIFRKNFTTFKRGYCITCYKVQGSEFKHVFVNLKSFWSCLLSNKTIKFDKAIKNNKSTLVINKKNARLLFSAFYTAATRPSDRLYLYWY